MGLLTRILNWKEKRKHPKEHGDWALYGLAGRGVGTSAGIDVTESTAAKYAAVFACAKILAEDVSSLPLLVYKRFLNGSRGKDRAPKHWAYPLLHEQANEMMTTMQLRETMMGHLALWGNAYALKYTAGAKTTALWPLMPNSMSMKFDKEDGVWWYVYQMPNGETRIWGRAEIFHVAGFGSNGLQGYSPIGQIREAIGLGLAAEEFGSKFFSNAARPSGVLTHPEVLDDKAFKRLKQSIHTANTGLDNASKLMILEEGMKFENIGIPPNDAQFLETRRFQVIEIARAYRIPPPMLQDLERATYSNYEQSSLGYVQFTLLPWLVRWEQAICQQLLTEQDKAQGYFAEHIVEGMLRGDIKTRYDAYMVGRQNGWLSANDIRALENMNPIDETDGGDMYLVPLNMIPADQVLNPAPPPTFSIEEENQAVIEGELRDIKQIANTRAADPLLRLAENYEKLFVDAVSRILGREIVDIRKALKKHLRSWQTFDEWITAYYPKMEPAILRHIQPVIVSYSEAVLQTRDILLADEAKAAWDVFVGLYGKGYTKRHIGASLGQLRVLMKEGGGPTELAEAIDLRCEAWLENRAAKVAADEAIRVQNAATMEAWKIQGVRKVRWKTHGGACPFCRRLSGMIVEMGQPFLDSDQSIAWQEPTDKDGNPGQWVSLTNKGYSKRHPPIHRGCKCTVEVG